MFDFRNGMLGVVIVSLALGGAIFGAYFAGIESVEHEVVKYNELADVTGLFDTDKSPQYIDYDPSTNYVGYYSQESYSEEMGQYYFAEDQVGYTPNEKDGKPIVNNYRIDLIPEIYDTRTVDIGDIRTAEDQPLPVTDRRYIVRYVATTIQDLTYWRGQATLLSDVISNMTYSEGTKQIRFSTKDVDWEGDYSPAGSGRMNLDTVLIIPQSWFKSYGSNPVYEVGIVNPAIDPSTVSGLTGGANSPIQSMIVDIMQKKAEVYSDPDYQNIITTYELDKLFIFYGTDPYPQMHPRLNLGDFSFQEVASRTSYLNPNNGVYLKEDE